MTSSRTAPRVLWVTEEPPDFADKGGSIRQAHLFRALAARFPVDLLCTRPVRDAEIIRAAGQVISCPAPRAPWPDRALPRRLLTLAIAGFAAWMVVVVEQTEQKLSTLTNSSPLLKEIISKVGGGDATSNATLLSFLFLILPVLLMAGKAPYTVNDELIGSRDTYVHFVQEPFDQASLVRPYLKWEWTLPSGVVVKEALRRAASIMQSEPCGPVYLMMQRETLTQHWRADEIRRYAAEQFAATSGGGGDPALVAALAERLVNAENPILITGYAGRHERDLLKGGLGGLLAGGAAGRWRRASRCTW